MNDSFGFPNDFLAAIAEWTAKFAGAESSFDATWELAGIEERWGDTLFFGGEPGGAAHYYAALRALIPQGTLFSPGKEHDRRMTAHTRVTDKLYAVGPDGRARPRHDARAHPEFVPSPPRGAVSAPTPSALPGVPQVSPGSIRTAATGLPMVRVKEEVKAERRETVQRARRARTKQESELGRVHQFGGHHHDYSLGAMWFAAAKALASGYPAQSSSACDWSRHYFELYNKEWTANLPASRWDSDGEQELSDVLALKDSLPIAGTKSPPEWVDRLVEGELRRAIATLPADPPPPEFESLAAILSDARKLAGR